MATTTVIASFLVKPGREAIVEKMFRDVIDPTRAEPGCISYVLHRDMAEPRQFFFSEEWKSDESLDHHLNEPYIVDLFARLPDHLETQRVSKLEMLA
jgi:quinol monooxygenase YgiN